MVKQFCSYWLQFEIVTEEICANKKLKNTNERNNEKPKIFLHEFVSLRLLMTQICNLI